MVPLRLGLVALAVAGCLEAPPGAPSKDGGTTPGSDASLCPHTSEEFAGTSLGGLWDDPDRTGASVLTVSGGEAHLSAMPDAEVDGTVSLSTLQDFVLPSADLRVDFRAAPSGDGKSGIGWYAAQDDYFLISSVGSALRATYSTPLGGGEQIVCAPCADYAPNQRVAAEMREVEGEIVFTATVGGEDWMLGSAPSSGRRYAVFLYAYEPLASASAATLDVERVEWDDCEAAARSLH